MRTLLLMAMLVAVVGLVGQQAEAVTVLGYGTASLIGSDLTDPDNNINDNVPGNPPYYGTGYDFLSASASSENWFSPGKGNEAALDLFDNKVGGGSNKWCCNGGTTFAAVQLTPYRRDELDAHLRLHGRRHQPVPARRRQRGQQGARVQRRPRFRVARALPRLPLPRHLVWLAEHPGPERDRVLRRIGARAGDPQPARPRRPGAPAAAQAALSRAQTT